jgi:RHS repeat-associated protein
VGNLEQVTSGGQTVNNDYLSDRVVSRSVAPNGAAFEVMVYDHQGRLTSRRPLGGSETEGFVYDTEDQLKQVRRSGTVAELLEYDSLGAVMFRKVGTKAYWYVGPFATVTADVSVSCLGYGCSPTTTPKVGVHVLLGGTRIATVRAPPSGSTADPAGDVLYYHRDLRGSVIATTLSGGRVGVKYRYGPYGELDKMEPSPVVSMEVADSELGYTGGLRLGWTPGSQGGSLLLLGARAYHAELRRWVQADTVDMLRYTYVAADPVNFVDPTGREPAATERGLVASSPSPDPTMSGAATTPDSVKCNEQENTCYFPELVVNTGLRASDLIWNQQPPARVDLYLRSFAPFGRFGGGFRGDTRGFTTDLNASSRMWGRVTVNLETGAVTNPVGRSSGTSCAGPPCSWAFGAREETANIAMSVTPLADGVTIVTLSGANPFSSIAPDIDLSLTLQVRPGGFLSATLRGDAFPYAEVFAVGSSGAKMLLTYRTLGGALTGPALYLPGKNSIWMGSFESHYP